MIARTGSPPNYRPLAAAFALFIVSLLVFRPGYAMFDTVAQYRQILSGAYDDWHPPIMARLWSLLLPLGPGAMPMLVVQLGAYWLGLGLLARALGGGKGWIVLAIGLFPPFLAWEATVLKDGQMAGALLCAAGLIGYWRLQGRAIPTLAIFGAIVCMGYAALVRANAAFSVAPLAVLLMPFPRTWAMRGVAITVGIVALLALLPAINAHLLGARDSGVRRTQAIYDLSAIAVQTGDAASTGISPASIAALRSGRCVKPLFWDPMNEREICHDAVSPLRALSPGQLYPKLATAILHHPLAYAAHRLAHLNATDRWLVAYRAPLAAPPTMSETNDVGLTSPGPAAISWQRFAADIVESPFGWPIFWILVALAGLWSALRSPMRAHHQFAIALFASALCQEASFAVLSISSDLRYHLWPMIATALACVIGWDAQTLRRLRGYWFALLALVFVIGLIARLSLPLPPAGYHELLL